MRPGILRLLPLLMLAVTLLAAGPLASSQAPPQTPPEATPAQTPAQMRVPAAGPGGMAFLREEGIYYLPPGAEQPVRLGPGKFPALSPDGKRVAFCLERKAPDPNAPNSKEPPGEAILEAVVFIGGFSVPDCRCWISPPARRRPFSSPGSCSATPSGLRQGTVWPWR